MKAYSPIYRYSLIVIILLSVLALSSCKKTFLEAKPSSTLVQPHTLADFQSLLSNTDVMNATGTLPIVSSDEIVITDFTAFQSLSDQKERNAYIWAKDIYAGQPAQPDWNALYSGVFYANSVLDALPTADGVGTAAWNNIKGWALFDRAYAFYALTQDFCVAYDSKTASSDLGIPLRLSSSIDALLPRATLEQTYQQIFSDLSQARGLLSNAKSGDYKMEPSRTGVYAFYSRIYLNMRDYSKAESYADSALAISNTLIDYNTLSTTAVTPFSKSNDETIYWSIQTNDYYELGSTTAGKYTIAPDIYSSYDANDLRKVIFFRTTPNGNLTLKRIYSGVLSYFTGLANDELYLIKAECAARRSDSDVALKYLNALLVNRFVSGTFVPLTKSNTGNVLATVLNERLKELIRRGLRWSDLKRLNKEGANITLTKTLNGQTYTLPPNDNRYVFPIPDDEITYSQIQQNPR